MQDNRLRRALGYALVRAFRVANRATAKALKGENVSAEQAHILLVLWTHGAMRIGDLQKTLALSSGTMTGALDRMREANLVRRVPDPNDGRVWLIEAAPMPPKRRRAIEEALVGVERDVFAVLTTDERDELLRLLQKIAPLT